MSFHNRLQALEGGKAVARATRLHVILVLTKALGEGIEAVACGILLGKKSHRFATFLRCRFKQLDLLLLLLAQSL